MGSLEWGKGSRRGSTCDKKITEEGHQRGVSTCEMQCDYTLRCNAITHLVRLMGMGAS